HFVRVLLFYCPAHPRDLHAFPTRRSSDLAPGRRPSPSATGRITGWASRSPTTPTRPTACSTSPSSAGWSDGRCCATSSPSLGAEIGEHTSELQSRENLVCRLLLEKKNNTR